MWRSAALVVVLATHAAAQFCPTDRCVRGGGPRRTDCLVQWTGISSETAACTDGAACDLDGTANGSCRFALAPCLDVYSTCPAPPPAIQQFVAQPGDHPTRDEIKTIAGWIALGAPND